MSTAVVVESGTVAARPAPAVPADIALLGCGTVGSALARLVDAPPSGARAVRITGALVRDRDRRRDVPAALRLTTNADALFEGSPDVVVELLGGTQPSRSLVLDALSRRIPVVTANKTLLARHGRELRQAALASGAPLLNEAAVIAGVPFLGTFARRPHAAGATRLEAIANGTSNFVLSACAGGQDFAQALTEAQRLGYAEPDPSNDVSGVDAAEKLVVLLQQFAGLAPDPDAFETRGIETVSGALARDAASLGGVIKQVITAQWSSELEGFVGPAFVPAAHPLAGVDGVENALLLYTSRGRLRFQGPGAGPEVTAATVLDDVNEVVRGVAIAGIPVPRLATPKAPQTGWLVSFDAIRLPDPVDLADYLASHGLYARRTTDRRHDAGRDRQSLLTWPAHRETLERALEGVRRATGASTTLLRALESGS